MRPASVTPVLATVAIRVVVAVTEPVAIGVAQVASYWGMTESFVMIGVRRTPVAHVFVCGIHAILMSLLTSLVSILIAIVGVGMSHRRSRQRLGMCGTQAPVAPERQWKSENSEKRGCLSSHKKTSLERLGLAAIVPGAFFLERKSEENVALSQGASRERVAETFDLSWIRAHETAFTRIALDVVYRWVNPRMPK